MEVVHFMETSGPVDMEVVHFMETSSPDDMEMVHFMDWPTFSVVQSMDW